MTDHEAGRIHNVTPGGISGEQPETSPFKLLVAPTTLNGLNHVRLPLIPVACVRINDVRFVFDSSFIPFDMSGDPKNATPDDIRAEMDELARLVKANPESPLSIFGHADPTGDDDYNKELSGRRAKALFALLTRDTGMWEQLFSGPKSIAGDNWEPGSLQVMRNATGLPENAPRDVLFKAYMDLLCGSDFRLSQKGFLGQGADPGGKGDFQGCGEFNPVLVLSQTKQRQFEKAKQQRDQSTIELRKIENAPNRRVTILLFKPGSRIEPAHWPCPRVTEGVAGCRARFFSDGEKRRSNRLFKDDRRFANQKDTFACRFYHRISSRSPCESSSGCRRILLDDPFLGFLRGMAVQLRYADGSNETSQTDESGSVCVRTDRGSFADLEFTTSLRQHVLRVFVVLAGVSSKAGAWQRLVNLGYIHDPQPPADPPSDETLGSALAEFQATHGTVPTGLLDGSTAESINAVHNLTVAWKDEQKAGLPDALASELPSRPKDAVA